MLRFFSAILVSIIPIGIYAGTVDSLIAELPKAKSDTSKIKILFEIVENELNDELWPPYNDQAYELANQLSSSSNNKIRKFGIKAKADALVNRGFENSRKGNIKLALEYYHQSLKIFEEIGDKEGISYCFNNIGFILRRQGETKRALENFLKSLEIKKEIGDNKLSGTLNNIGFIYLSDKIFNKAEAYFTEALQESEKNNYLQGIANSFNNLGLVKFEEKEFEKSKVFHQKALEIRKQLGDKQGIAFSLSNLSKLQIALGDFDSAKEYGLLAFKLSEELKIPENIGNSAEILSIIFSEKKDYENAFRYHKIFKMMTDSIYNIELKNDALRKQMQYEWEKNEAVLNAQKQSELAVEGEKSKWYKVFSVFIVGFLFVAICFVIFLFTRYKVINKQKSVIENQHLVLEEKNKSIIDSITYAKRIQEAILKEQNHISIHLPSHFVIFIPKDIVSGDFYWSIEKTEVSVSGDEVKCWYLAVADCTGHGVPGAFLTMLGTAFLNEITSVEASLAPNEILNMLKEKVVKDLGQTGNVGETKDGMDVSLCKLNLNTFELEWSGANNPLWIMKESKVQKLARLPAGPKFKIIEEAVNSTKFFELFEVKPDKQPIGYSESSVSFANHKIQLQKGDEFYLFSDGFADQFGGSTGKKYKKKQMKELLLSMADQSMDMQKRLLINAHNSWKGELEQIDDICIIGVKV